MNFLNLSHFVNGHDLFAYFMSSKIETHALVSDVHASRNDVSTMPALKGVHNDITSMLKVSLRLGHLALMELCTPLDTTLYPSYIPPNTVLGDALQ